MLFFNQITSKPIYIKLTQLGLHYSWFLVFLWAIKQQVILRFKTTILKSVRNVFAKAKTEDFWETLSKDQKQELDKGLAEIVSEDTVEYETIMKKHRNPKKLKKETK